jgi:hypothetical protein
LHRLPSIVVKLDNTDVFAGECQERVGESILILRRECPDFVDCLVEQLRHGRPRFNFANRFYIQFSTC